MVSEKGNHDPGVAGQGVEGHAILKLSQVERLRPAQLPSHAIDLGEHFLQVDEDLDRGREPYPLGAGQIAERTAVRTVAVGRKVPEVGAGVALFIGMTDSAVVFAEDQDTVPPVMQVEQAFGLDTDLVVRGRQLLDDLGLGVKSQDAINPLPSLRRRNAAFGQDDRVELE